MPRPVRVYAAYRKTGYSKKFRAEYEADILLHQAAKEFFDKQGIKKLPKVKELNAEYTELLKQKKAVYPEYRKAREEMQRLLRAQKNIERFFADETPQPGPAAEPVNETRQRSILRRPLACFFCLYGE